MTGRERILMALQHKEADRVPTGENQVYGALAGKIVGYKTLYSTGWEELNALWEGRRDDVVHDYVKTSIDLARKLDWDYIRVPFMPVRKEYKVPKKTGPYSWLNEEGQEMHFNPDVGNLVLPDFKTDLTIDDLPDPRNDPFTVDDSQLDALRQIVKELKDTHFIICRPSFDGTFPWDQTVGMEEFLVRMLTDEEFVQRAIDVYVGRNIKMIEAALDAGADAIMTTDDYSDNRGPIMGPESFRKFIIPGIKRQVEAIHKKGKFFIKHTDGNLWSILEDLIATGIDGLHGIQVNIGMDMAKLKEKYGNRLCFFGGVNCESLISGTPEVIRKEVYQAIRGAARGGGLVVATSNIVSPGSKFENYMAMREAISDYGKYPITI